MKHKLGINRKGYSFCERNVWLENAIVFVLIVKSVIKFDYK